MDMTSTRRHGKKVIHVVQHLAPGGLESLTLDLLSFANPNDQVLIVSLEGTKEESLKNWPRLEAYQNQLVFLGKKPGVHLGLILTLIKAFRAVKPDVVHTHHIGPLLYAGYAARMAGVAVRIHTEHDAWHLEDKKHRRIQGMVLKAAKPTLVADASHVKEKLTACFSGSNSVVIKNGVDCKKFKPGSKQLARELFKLPNDKTIIGMAGRLEQVKGHDLAIKALALLEKEVILVIAGDGSQRKYLENLVEKLQLKERVLFLGLVENMPRFYQSLDLFCLPSRFEGLPLSPLEAQACNIPAVVTNVGASAEVLCPKTGVLAKSNDVADLSHSLARTLANRSTHLPREFVVTNNNIHQMVKAYDDLSMGELA
ncbi:glycosyltransferase [Vibrio sp. F74]|uniref:glycosyltransferase n=1 Tax=Vibrio sp. F74 TaxID=700020 RepID=UPI0035F5F0E7